MDTRPNILIVSAFQKGQTLLENTNKHNEAVEVLRSRLVPFKVLQGKYNGVTELSILVSGFEHRELVESISKSNNQECYLESHNDRTTNLVYPDGARVSIGVLTGVTKDEAESVGSYSYDPLVDQYFVTK